MSNIFLVSDTHFGHYGVCKFMREDGVTKLRPWDDPEKMDEDLVKLWNDRVKPNDKVYHLGDVAMNLKGLKVVHRLNGKKILLKGNHDIYSDYEYKKYFNEIHSYYILNNMLLSHIPVHPGSLGKYSCNIHGHLHAGRVKDVSQNNIDIKYYCVSIEHTDFAPILFDEVLEKISQQNKLIC